MLTEGGIDNGSAVGLAKHLDKLNLEGVDTFVDSTASIIILNPGQTIYSSKLNKTMSHRSWLARRKTNALSSEYEINTLHNHVSGHRTSKEHINTVLEHVVPQLVYSSAHIWVIGIIDGAETFIEFADARLSAGKKIIDGRKVVGMAFIQPLHDVDKIESDATKTELKTKGRSWVLSEELPEGTNTMAPLVTLTTSGGKATDDTTGRMRKHSNATTLKQLRKEEKIARSELKKANHDPSKEVQEVPGSIKIPVLPKIKTDTGMGEGSHSSLWNDPFGENKTPESGSTDQSAASSFAGSSLDAPFKGPIPAEGRPMSSFAGLSINDSIEGPPVEGEKRDIVAVDSPMMEPVGSQIFDYSLPQVSCPTFSSGVKNNHELILPSIMKSVLNWFEEKAKVKRPQIFE